LDPQRVYEYVWEALPDTLATWDPASPRGLAPDELRQALLTAPDATLGPVLDLAMSEDARLRRWAIVSLSGYPQDSGLEFLKAVLIRGDVDDRMTAAYTMGQRLDSAAEQPLQAALGDRDPRVREEAESALRLIQFVVGAEQP
jgi:hypothetical protein